MHNKKNIILFSNTLWFLEKFKFELIEKLIQSKNVQCLYLNNGPKYDISRIKFLESKGVEFKVVTFYIFLNLLKKISFNLGFKHNSPRKPDKIIIFTLLPILLSSLVFIKYRSKTTYVLEGLGRVFTSRKIVYRILKRVVIIVYKILFSKCFSVVTLNYSDAIYISEMSIAPLNKIKIIPGTGLDIKKVKKQCQTLTFKAKYIDFVARLIAEKGIYRFVYLRSNFKKYHPEIANTYKFRVITPQSDIDSISSKDLQYLNQLGIFLKPYLDNPYIYYSESKALVIPTTYGEGLSRVALEAAYLGIPLLVSKNRGTEDLFPINYKYFMISENPNTLAKQLLEMINDSEYFLKLKNEMKSLIESRYTTEKSIDSFCYAIEEQD